MILVTGASDSWVEERPFEVVERKGIGHPDSLADGIAERVSQEYSRHCLQEFGHILHHNVDKTALLGGSANVGLGWGEVTSPVHVLINGRVSAALGGQQIAVDELLEGAARSYLGAVLPLLRPDDIVVQIRMSSASSPGAVAINADSDSVRKRWFAPTSLDDLPERARLFANDTSCGVGFAPLSTAERVALAIESDFNSGDGPEHPYGSDIKVMVCRENETLHITTCVPQIAERTPSLEAYLSRTHDAKLAAQAVAEREAPHLKPVVHVNTRDIPDEEELYLTVTGSSIESGDEGVVGRGNRSNGLISLSRGMSLEGVSGKNPVYHVGKLYNLLAQDIAERLLEITGSPTTVTLVSQSGRDLVDPWYTAVEQVGTPADAGLVRRVIADVMENLDGLRRDLLNGKRTTF